MSIPPSAFGNSFQFYSEKIMYPLTFIKFDFNGDLGSTPMERIFLILLIIAYYIVITGLIMYVAAKSVRFIYTLETRKISADLSEELSKNLNKRYS